MSANETFDTYYAETAYTPEKRREWETENPKRDKMFGSRLSWDRKTKDSGNEFLYGFKWLVTSQEFEERREEKGLQGQHIFNELKARLDHQALMPPNHTALAKVFIMTMGISKGLTYISAFGYFAFSVLLPLYVIFGDATLPDYKDAMIYLFFLLGPVFLSAYSFGKSVYFS